MCSPIPLQPHQTYYRRFSEKVSESSSIKRALGAPFQQKGMEESRSTFLMLLHQLCPLTAHCAATLQAITVTFGFWSSMRHRPSFLVVSDLRRCGSDPVAMECRSLWSKYATVSAPNLESSYDQNTVTDEPIFAIIESQYTSLSSSEASAILRPFSFLFFYCFLLTRPRHFFSGDTRRKSLLRHVMQPRLVHRQLLGVSLR